MKTQAFLAHCSPGRLRIRIPSKKGDTAFFESLRRNSEQLPGVMRAEANAATGSLLLLLAPGHELALEDAASRFGLSLRTRSDLTLEERAANRVRDLNRSVRNFTGGELDLKSIAFFGCIAAGIVQLGTGNLAMPAWFVAFWYAYAMAGNGKPIDRDNLKD